MGLLAQDFLLWKLRYV